LFPQKKEENFNCSLSVLAATSVHLNSDEFAFAVESCPLAEEIIVLSAGLIDDDLYRLMNLSRLTRYLIRSILTYRYIGCKPAMP
jgi:hypothetical protein